MRRAIVALAVLVACDRAPSPPMGAAAVAAPASGPAPTSSAGDPVRSSTRTPAGRACEVAGALNRLTGDELPAAEVTGWCGELTREPAALERYVDRLLGSRLLGREVLPSLLFGTFVNVKNYYAMPTGFILMSSAPGRPGPAPYFIRRPCAPEEAVEVRPWWDPTTEVEVCPDAYRPEAWVVGERASAYHSRQILSCDSQTGSPENEASAACGCGPNLIRCMRDDVQYLEVLTSMAQEVKRTTAWVLEHDLPVESLFTGNATFRDRNVERYYRRQEIGARQLADPLAALGDVERWPTEGRFAPRREIVPGQHAGLLTSPQLLHWLPDRRQRQRGYYELMWCAGRNSFGATTAQVLELSEGSGNLAFVHDGWRKLAATPICTDCHARLDYGFQFFHGYPDSRASTHFVPSLALPGKGPLYGDGIHDLRGEAPLTPRGFAELAAGQPEFLGCVARKLTDYALGDSPRAEDRAAIAAELARTHRLRPALRVALLAFARRALVPPAAAPARAVAVPAPVEARGAAPPSPPGAPKTAIAPALRAALDRHCIVCHEAVPFVDFALATARPFDLRGASLPRPLVVRMADHVAHRMMPKDPDALTEAERAELVDLLIAALFSDPAARAEAAAYYHETLRALPTLPIDSAFAVIHNRSGRRSGGRDLGGLESALYIDQATFTPGFAAVTGLEALFSCRETGQIGARLDDCIARAFGGDLVRGLVP